MKTAGKVVIGVLAGAAAGAILGVLFAPDKGSETRRKIVERSKNFKEDVKEKFSGFLATTKEKLDTKMGDDQNPKEKMKTEKS